jgi:hypothetical protein
MPDYSKSKIYRLDCGDLIYIGSTTQPLAKRKGKHKTDYLNNYCCRSKIVYQYAVDNDLSLTEDIRIELICECPCDNKEQLSAIEGKYIRQYKEEYGDKCVNKCIAGRTDKEYYEDNKDKILEQKKEYYEDNKDKIAKQKKEYREKNKDKIADQHKEYYENNKEKHSQHMKEYNQKNKDKISQQKKEYRECNKDKIAEQQKQYKQKNKDKIKAYKQQYYLFKKIDKIFYD